MPTACITDDALAAWAAGTATDAAVKEMTSHVGHCETCRVVLAEVARTSGERPPALAYGRYQLQEQVGAGGMGTVWAAWDPTVRRRVAVKVLHDASGDGAHRAQRFLHERQVLAGLEHPHIARLLDAGETAEGRPWFAMDFVDGQPLDVFCDARKLTTRQRLELLLPAFDAVSYAHQHLVVHRDLKPSNILVGADGQPWLVDFGIARLLEGDAGLTQTGMTPMTPAYASPEQVRREPVATTSDVYALGVVLYETLTGVSPYRVATTQLDALLTAVREQNPEAPSLAIARATPEAVACRASSRERLRSELADQLDDIVLMALRKVPADRYPSVQALADDVRAALEGRPTLARRGDTAYRALSFVRRHKVSAAAVVAAVVALGAGLASTVWQARRAEQERDIAQRRFAQVRSLAHAVLFDYHDGIAALAGSTPLRERLVKDAQGYLDGLAAETTSDRPLRLELAQGFLKLGDVQGDPFGASLGDLVSAKASYLRGRALAEALVAEDPRDWDARRVVASSHEKVAAVLEVSGELATALSEYELASRLDGVLVAERPDDLDERMTFSRDELSAGQVLTQLGDVDQASRRLERALLERRSVVAQRNDRRSRRGVATVLISLADVRGEQGKPNEAITLDEEASTILTALAEEQPDDASAQRDAARAWDGLAGYYRIQAKPERAVALSHKSLAAARKAVDADPQNSVARRDLVVSLGNLGMSLGAMEGKADVELAKTETEALEVQRALAHDEPDNLQYERDLLSVLSMATAGSLDRGDFVTAEARTLEHLAVAARLTAAGGMNATAQENGVMAHSSLAAVRAGQKRFDEALAENRLAIAGLDQVIAENPGLARVQVRRAYVMAKDAEFFVLIAESAPKEKRREAWVRAREAAVAAQKYAEEIEAAGHATGTLGLTRKGTEEVLARCDAALKR